MARKPGTRPGGDFVLFDVYYDDGTQRSNRRVPASAVGGLDGDDPARTIIEAQDREIAEKSGLSPARIKDIFRAGEKAKLDQKEREKRERKAHKAAHRG